MTESVEHSPPYSANPRSDPRHGADICIQVCGYPVAVCFWLLLSVGMMKLEHEMCKNNSRKEKQKAFIHYILKKSIRLWTIYY